MSFVVKGAQRADGFFGRLSPLSDNNRTSPVSVKRDHCMPPAKKSVSFFGIKQGEHRVKRHYGIRTERYKLIHFYYDIDEWELFDLEKDPHEMNNVYNDPAYAKVKKTMHAKLKKLRRKYKDSDELNQHYISKIKTQTSAPSR